MMARLGKHQLCLLATMGSPFYLLVVKDRIAKGLVARGYLESRKHPCKPGDSFFGISPAGLRALAEAIERGDLEQFFDPKFQRDRVRIYIDGRKSK